MSQTVSELLVGVLEQIGVRHIFGLIGDSLNPLADAGGEARSNGSAFVTKKARHRPPPASQSSPEGSRFARAPPVPAAITWSRASTKRAATMRPCSRCPVTWRA